MRKPTCIILAAVLAVAFTVSGCGGLKKKEFLPEYEAFKEENAQRFTTVETGLTQATTKIGDLEKADTAIREEIQDAKDEAMAASEQGDADTLESARSAAQELDASVRTEVLTAVETSKKETMDAVRKSSEETNQRVMTAAEEARKAALEAVQATTSKSAGEIEALRSEVATSLAKARPTTAADVKFALGKAELSQATRADLDRAVEVIKQNPDAMVLVVGHADSTPIRGGKYKDNLILSEARAQEVANYLKSKGVTNPMKMMGRSYFSTAGLQSSMDGKAESRRVEVIISRG